MGVHKKSLSLSLLPSDKHDIKVIGYKFMESFLATCRSPSRFSTPMKWDFIQLSVMYRWTNCFVSGLTRSMKRKGFGLRTCVTPGLTLFWKRSEVDDQELKHMRCACRSKTA